MRTRGKVLRAPGVGPGLVMIEGRQFRFTRDIWRSANPPKTGLNVEVDLDAQQQIAGMTVIPTAGLPTEHTEFVLRPEAKRRPETTMQTVARFAVPALLAGALMLVVWLLS